MSGQDMIPISRPYIGDAEKQAVLQVLESGMLVQGPRVAAFEEAFAAVCGVRYAIAVSSGTAALHVALMAHGIGPGDEVITTPFTFIASVNSILYVGARPVFVDIEEDTFDIDPALIEEASRLARGLSFLFIFMVTLVIWTLFSMLLGAII